MARPAPARTTKRSPLRGSKRAGAVAWPVDAQLARHAVGVGGGSRAAPGGRSRCPAVVTALPVWFWILKVTLSDSGPAEQLHGNEFGCLSGRRAPPPHRCRSRPAAADSPGGRARSSSPPPSRAPSCAALEAAAVEVAGEVLRHQAVAVTLRRHRARQARGRRRRARTCRSWRGRWQRRGRRRRARGWVSPAAGAGLAEGVGHLDDGGFGLGQVGEHGASCLGFEQVCDLGSCRTVDSAVRRSGSVQSHALGDEAGERRARRSARSRSARSAAPSRTTGRPCSRRR